MAIYVVMGVSGVGKTTVGKLVAEKLDLPFYDADDFHTEVNLQKMSQGISLEDADRREWLHLLSQKIKDWNQKEGAVLACSALKETYREKLQSIPKEEMHWIFLHSEYEVVLQRISERKDHYFKPNLLKSQYEALQFPTYGIHVDVDKPLNNIIDEIMVKLKNKEKKAQIGLLGLGVMGKSLALNFASRNIKVAVYNRQVKNVEVDVARNFAMENKENFDFSWFDDLENFVEALDRPRKIFLMVNAGKVVDLVIDNLIPFLEEGDLIIDGGNSHYKDTEKREQYLKSNGILFLGTGISGGEEGARKGPSIMPGGAVEAYEKTGAYLEKIAAKDKDGRPCCSYIGPGGSGHFVKMLHNGIEYGEMQLIAETYHYIRFYTESTPEEIADLFEEWNLEMKSFLLEISIDILRRKEEGGYLLDQILDAAKQKGTGGWSTNAALELGVPFDTITAAVMARTMSAKKEIRVSAEKQYEHEVSKKGNLKELSCSLFEAYKTVVIINHAIGFDLLNEAANEYKWNLDLSEIARVWTNGCIIRSAFMEELVDLLKKNPKGDILLNKKIVSKIKDQKESLLEVTGNAIKAGFPMPVMSAAANYFLQYSPGQSSANMIQAQRDYFGAHTYERIDKPRGDFFHTRWLQKED